MPLLLVRPRYTKMHTSIQEEGTGIGSELERFV
jgi:hypothetical protein